MIIMSQSRLKDMTLEELWELFPITLSAHNPDWPEWANEEILELSALLRDYGLIINHIGSTVIPNIQAKPIIDILVEIEHHNDWQQVREAMEEAGYICMSVSDIRMSFNKGYTPYGYADKVFHIHFHIVGDNDEIYFRDYLRDIQLKVSDGHGIIGRGCTEWDWMSIRSRIFDSQTAKAVNIGSKGYDGASPAPTEVHKSGLSIMLASSLSS